VSVIINRLLEEGLVLKRDVVRGRVGQPSQPIALNPEGALSIGIQIGRRSLDLMVVDFLGQPLWRNSGAYIQPDVDAVFGAIAVQLRRIDDFLGPQRRARLHGVGLAAPLTFAGWRQMQRMSAADADAWRRTDIAARLQTLTPLPVVFAKDTAAASMAELLQGHGTGVTHFLYLFVGTLIGGALVLNGQPHRGLHGNAGAAGSMALGLAGGDGPGAVAPPQLLDVASLARLEARYLDAGLVSSAYQDERALQPPWLAETRAWIDSAADAIALVVSQSACLLDLDAVIVDGAMDRGLLAALLAALEAALVRYSWQGVARPPVLAGQVGADARVIGAAHLPLYANFAPVHDLFLKMGKR
jgi:predicted NBD/HSP70 family sugar kinase